jgi:hypothetical protein
LPRRKRLIPYYANKLVGKLDSNSGTPDVYILDKERETSEEKNYGRIQYFLVPPN